MLDVRVGLYLVESRWRDVLGYLNFSSVDFGCLVFMEYFYNFICFYNDVLKSRDD